MLGEDNVVLIILALLSFLPLASKHDKKSSGPVRDQEIPSRALEYEIRLELGPRLLLYLLTRSVSMTYLST